MSPVPRKFSATHIRAAAGESLGLRTDPYARTTRPTVASHRIREIQHATTGVATLAEAEGRLGTHEFLHVHRSTIVNVRRIHEIQPGFKGEYVMVRSVGTKLRTGRIYRENVQAMMRDPP